MNIRTRYVALTVLVLSVFGWRVDAAESALAERRSIDASHEREISRLISALVSESNDRRRAEKRVVAWLPPVGR